MQYVDTSLLVAALLNERSTALAQRWLGAQPAGELVISDWVVTEFSAALSMKLRTGELEPPQRNEVLAFFTRLTEASFNVLPVSRQDFQTAARFADQYATGLRAGDALHLAIASHHGASLHTLDKRLVGLGQALGVDAALVRG
jgi:predicted nucleic acid-binding protein